MTKALDDFITAYRAPKSAVEITGDFACSEWVYTDDHGWNPCSVRKTSRWGDCPNRANHRRPVLQHKELDQITEGDRVTFYHHASNRDQWATVLEWTPVWHFPDGAVAEWEAVLHIEDLGLGNGFTAGTKVQRHRVRRHGSIVKYGYTPGVFR